jgi:diaminopimelate epimerase
VAKYVYDHAIAVKENMTIETGNGVLKLQLQVESGKAKLITVDMGKPILEAAMIPTKLSSDTVIGLPVEFAGYKLNVTCVSMGNPHCVAFVPRATDDLVLKLGPLIETDSRFPKRTNVEFVEVISPTELRQRTWERGSGETWACGTGASAVCVAGFLTGNSQREVLIHLLGGDLRLKWDQDSGHVLMTGQAIEVFSGQW